MTALLKQAYNQELQNQASLRKAFENSLENSLEKSFRTKVERGENGNGSGKVCLPKKFFLLTPPSKNGFASSLPAHHHFILRPKHMRILTLYVTGKFKRTEISELVGCTDATITNVIKSHLGQQYIKNHYQEIKGDFDSLAVPAVDALREGLHSSAEETRIKTAIDYFKLIGAQTKKVVEHTGKDGGPIQVEDVKQKLFNKLGLNPEILIEVENEQRNIEQG